MVGFTVLRVSKGLGVSWRYALGFRLIQKKMCSSTVYYSVKYRNIISTMPEKVLYFRPSRIFGLEKIPLRTRARGRSQSVLPKPNSQRPGMLSFLFQITKSSSSASTVLSARFTAT